MTSTSPRADQALLASLLPGADSTPWHLACPTVDDNRIRLADAVTAGWDTGTHIDATVTGPRITLTAAHARRRRDTGGLRLDPTGRLRIPYRWCRAHGVAAGDRLLVATGRPDGALRIVICAPRAVSAALDLAA